MGTVPVSWQKGTVTEMVVAGVVFGLSFSPLEIGEERTAARRCGELDDLH